MSRRSGAQRRKLARHRRLRQAQERFQRYAIDVGRTENRAPTLDEWTRITRL